MATLRQIVLIRTLFSRLFFRKAGTLFEKAGTLFGQTSPGLWVTQHDGAELNYVFLSSYSEDQESVTDADIVLWHMTSVHHLPRREDGTWGQVGPQGVALVMWSGFDLRPRNLFDGTPFFD